MKCILRYRAPDGALLREQHVSPAEAFAAFFGGEPRQVAPDHNRVDFMPYVDRDGTRFARVGHDRYIDGVGAPYRPRALDATLPPARTAPRARGAGRPRAQTSRSSARSGDSPDDAEPAPALASAPPPRARLTFGFRPEDQEPRPCPRAPPSACNAARGA